MIFMYSYFESARSIHVKADGYNENKDRVAVDIYNNYKKEPLATLVKSWGKASHYLTVVETWQWLHRAWGMRQGNPVSRIKEIKQYAFYKKNNVYGMRTQVFGDWARNGLSRYLATKLKWNTCDDIEKLKHDFCSKMFPNASNEFYFFIELYDEFASKIIDIKTFLRKGFYFLDKIRHKIKTPAERERWEFYALYFHERTLAVKFDAIKKTEKKSKVRHLWQMISFLKGIEDRGVMDSNNWIKTFYVKVLKKLGENPSGYSCPEMPAMKINPRKIDKFFEQDWKLYKVSNSVMCREPL